MTPGGLWEEEEEEEREEREDREVHARRRGAPRALPASDDFKRRATKDEQERRRQSEARDAERLNEPGPSRPSEQSPGEGRAASRSATSSSAGQPYDIELTAQLEVGGQTGEALLLDCGSTLLSIRAEGVSPDEGVTARLAIQFRELKGGAFQSRNVRVLGTLSGVAGEEKGWTCSLRVTAAQPTDHYYTLCTLLDQRADV